MDAPFLCPQIGPTDITKLRLRLSKQQRMPALATDTGDEDKAMSLLRRRHVALLPGKQPGQDRVPAGCQVTGKV